MSWRNLRSISTDPLSNFLSKLAQDQIMKEAQAESSIGANLEEDKFIGKHNHSIVEIRDIGKSFTNAVDIDTVFYMPEEPDRNRLRLWVKFNNGSDTQFDYSLFDNVIQNKGYMLPVPITSPTYDEGIVGGQLALQYNNIDSMPKSAKAQFGSEVAYTRIKDNANIRLSSYLDGTITGADGFTISMLIRPMELYNDTDINGVVGWNRRLCFKIDNTSITYGYELRITPLGTLVIIFRRAGVDYKYFVDQLFELETGNDFDPRDFHGGDFRTVGFPRNTPKTNTENYWVRLDVIYKFSDNSVKVRYNDVEQTVQVDTNLSLFSQLATPTSHTTDLLINSGPFTGNFADRPLGVGIYEWADFRIYGGQLTADESHWLYTNKYSITDIPFGQVAIMGHTMQSDALVTIPDITKDPFGLTRLFPTAPNGNEWFSTQWNNGIVRTIQNPPTSDGLSDPYDSQFFVDNIGDPKVTIQGNGTAKFQCTTASEGSPRVTVLADKWQNVEVTLYTKCPTISIGQMECEIRAKTDHYIVHNQAGTDDQLFGGYIFYTDYSHQQFALRREIAHAIGYSERRNIVPTPLPANTWLGFKAVLYNLQNGNVKLEYYMDTTGGVGGGTWVKVTEGIDDGTWGGSGGGLPAGYTPPTQGSGIRTDIGSAGGFVEYKWYSIREIVNPAGDVPDEEG